VIARALEILGILVLFLIGVGAGLGVWAFFAGRAARRQFDREHQEAQDAEATRLASPVGQAEALFRGLTPAPPKKRPLENIPLSDDAFFGHGLADAIRRMQEGERP
jgi:hypothetical protein